VSAPDPVSRADGPPPSRVLAVNAGSSSLKLALFEVGPGGEAVRWRSQLDVAPGTTPDLGRVAAALAAEGWDRPDAIGHRVVHGGADHVAPARVDDRLLAELEDLVAFAPLHQPACLAGIRAAARTWPDRPQVACFDTAFHHTLEPEAFTYALPAAARADGTRRFGFHGLSYEYLVDHLGAEADGRVVMAHLGAGASLCAAVDGRSVDTTMGLTPAGGLVMVSRPGDLDPGVLIHLLRRGGERPAGPGAHPIDADELEDLVNHRSGLAGMGGHQGDARALLAARAAGDPDATLALAVFTRTAAKQVAGMAAAMGGIDALVFTAGIGQRAPALRAEICHPLAFLGVSLDDAANQQGAAVISDGPVTVRVVETDEERMIARHAAALVVRG